MEEVSNLASLRVDSNDELKLEGLIHTILNTNYEDASRACNSLVFTLLNASNDEGEKEKTVIPFCLTRKLTDHINSIIGPLEEKNPPWHLLLLTCRVCQLISHQVEILYAYFETEDWVHLAATMGKLFITMTKMHTSVHFRPDILEEILYLLIAAARNSSREHIHSPPRLGEQNGEHFLVLEEILGFTLGTRHFALSQSNEGLEAIRGLKQFRVAANIVKWESWDNVYNIQINKLYKVLYCSQSESEDILLQDGSNNQKALHVPRNIVEDLLQKQIAAAETVECSRTDVLQSLTIATGDKELLDIEAACPPSPPPPTPASTSLFTGNDEETKFCYINETNRAKAKSSPVGMTVAKHTPSRASKIIDVQLLKEKLSVLAEYDEQVNLQEFSENEELCSFQEVAHDDPCYKFDKDTSETDAHHVHEFHNLSVVSEKEQMRCDSTVTDASAISADLDVFNAKAFCEELSTESSSVMPVSIATETVRSCSNDALFLFSKLEYNVTETEFHPAFETECDNTVQDTPLLASHSERLGSTVNLLTSESVGDSSNLITFSAKPDSTRDEHKSHLYNGVCRDVGSSFIHCSASEQEHVMIPLQNLNNISNVSSPDNLVNDLPTASITANPLSSPCESLNSSGSRTDLSVTGLMQSYQPSRSVESPFCHNDKELANGSYSWERRSKEAMERHNSCPAQLDKEASSVTLFCQADRKHSLAESNTSCKDTVLCATSLESVNLSHTESLEFLVDLKSQQQQLTDSSLSLAGSLTNVKDLQTSSVPPLKGYHFPEMHNEANANLSSVNEEIHPNSNILDRTMLLKESQIIDKKLEEESSANQQPTNSISLDNGEIVSNFPESFTNYVPRHRATPRPAIPSVFTRHCEDAVRSLLNKENQQRQEELTDDQMILASEKFTRVDGNHLNQKKSDVTEFMTKHSENSDEQKNGAQVSSSVALTGGKNVYAPEDNVMQETTRSSGIQTETVHIPTPYPSIFKKEQMLYIRENSLQTITESFKDPGSAVPLHVTADVKTPFSQMINHDKMVLNRPPIFVDTVPTPCTEESKVRSDSHFFGETLLPSNAHNQSDFDLTPLNVKEAQKPLLPISYLNLRKIDHAITAASASIREDLDEKKHENITGQSEILEEKHSPQSIEASSHVSFEFQEDKITIGDSSLQNTADREQEKKDTVLVTSTNILKGMLGEIKSIECGVKTEKQEKNLWVSFNNNEIDNIPLKEVRSNDETPDISGLFAEINYANFDIAFPNRETEEYARNKANAVHNSNENSRINDNSNVNETFEQSFENMPTQDQEVLNIISPKAKPIFESSRLLSVDQPQTEPVESSIEFSNIYDDIPLDVSTDMIAHYAATMDEMLKNDIHSLFGDREEKIYIFEKPVDDQQNNAQIRELSQAKKEDFWHANIENNITENVWEAENTATTCHSVAHHRCLENNRPTPQNHAVDVADVEIQEFKECIKGIVRKSNNEVTGNSFDAKPPQNSNDEMNSSIPGLGYGKFVSFRNGIEDVEFLNEHTGGPLAIEISVTSCTGEVTSNEKIIVYPRLDASEPMLGSSGLQFTDSEASSWYDSDEFDLMVSTKDGGVRRKKKSRKKHQNKELCAERNCNVNAKKPSFSDCRPSGSLSKQAKKLVIVADPPVKNNNLCCWPL